MQLRIAVRIIEALTEVKSLSAVAKTIYIAAMMQQPQSIHMLADHLRLDRKTLTRHCAELEISGWMRFADEAGRRRPVPTLPVEIEAMLAVETGNLLDMSHFKGEEATMCFADWIIAPRIRLVRDARPSFMLNPETRQPLELDIYAPQVKWGLEHNGDQHYGVTDLYPDKDQLRERQKRDVLKVGLCKQNDVRLYIVTKNDLSLERMLLFFPPDIPRRDFDPKGPYVQMLERVGRECARGRYWDRG